MSYRIDEDEYEVLAGDNCSRLSHEARLVYLLCIRPRMDFDTGMAGGKGGAISYSGIAQVLEYSPPRGSTKPGKRYKKESIRAILAELERVGLVVWVKNEDWGLFFECPRADRDKRPKNMSNPRATLEQPHSSNPMGNPATPSNDGGFDKDEKPHEQPHDITSPSPKSNPYPVSGIREERESDTPLPPKGSETLPGDQAETPSPEILAARRCGALSAMMRSLGVAITAGNSCVVAWERQGVTDAEAREAIDRARLRKPAPEQIPANYLAPIVAQVVGEREGKNRKPPATGQGTPRASFTKRGGNDYARKARQVPQPATSYPEPASGEGGHAVKRNRL